MAETPMADTTVTETEEFEPFAPVMTILFVFFAGERR